MPDISDLLADPLVQAAAAAHGYAMHKLPWHTFNLNEERMVDLGVKDDAPSLHIDPDHVLLRWFTPEQAVAYSAVIRDGEVVRRVHVESVAMPHAVVASMEDRVLGEVVDIPGAWRMDVLGAWVEDATGITDASVMIDVEPYEPAFLGDDEPAIIAWLSRYGYRRRGLSVRGKLRPHGGEAFLTTNASYVTYPNGVTYTMVMNGSEIEEEVAITGLLPDALLAGCVGRPLGDLADVPGLTARCIAGARHLAPTNVTLLRIDRNMERRTA